MNTGQTQTNGAHARQISAWPDGCDPHTFEGIKRLAGIGQDRIAEFLDPNPTVEDVSVDLIVSGYAWVCDRCERWNDELEKVEAVRCRKCGTRFNTNILED